VLALACVVGLAASIALRLVGPIGEDVSGQVDLAPLLEDRTSPSFGPADAPVTVVVFTDYQCVACRAGHPAMWRAVKAAGDVRIVFRDLPVQGPRSTRAARLALAAQAQGRYPAVHDVMMRERRALDEAVLREVFDEAEVDWRRAERDAAAAPRIDAQLARNGTDALQLGVAGTPAYLIGPYRVIGALSEREFAKAFAQAREAAP
jgi:protein-disulfide isomerase